MIIIRPYTEAELAEALRRVLGGESLKAIAASTRRSAKFLREKLKARGWVPARSPRQGLALVLPTRPAAEPTDAPPGSERKILVLRGRYERGQRLHHERDAGVPPREGAVACHRGTWHGDRPLAESRYGGVHGADETGGSAT
jgi:hypothetical protein